MGIAIWDKALDIARQTPEARHRGVDFLRAASIIVVVIGHWCMAAPWVDEKGAHIAHMLGQAEWTQWLTWGLQVMPIFFFVGGYSNGISWSAALRDDKPWSEWLASRLGRLLAPALPLILFWIVAGFLAIQLGVPIPMVRVASQIALVPTWFLAVYVLAILLVPLAYQAWSRFGLVSIWVPVGLAVIMDYAYFGLGLKGLGWTNFLFVWFSVHQLGFAWLHKRAAVGTGAWLWCLGGLALLVLMTELGPWPRSMMGVPGSEVSNTTPPHLSILALAAFQFGFVRLIESRLSAWLQREGAWAGTVLINGMIMTTFLWHSTVMMLLYGIAVYFDGVGLHAYPGTGTWWLMKAGWIIAFTIVLIPVVGFTSRWERIARTGPPVAGVRQVLGSLFLASGLALLAFYGVVNKDSGQLLFIPLLLPFLGALIAGIIGVRVPGGTH